MYTDRTANIYMCKEQLAKDTIQSIKDGYKTLIPCNSIVYAKKMYQRILDEKINGITIEMFYNKSNTKQKKKLTNFD